jgi:hypothetical protein
MYVDFMMPPTNGREGAVAVNQRLAHAGVRLEFGQPALEQFRSGWQKHCRYHTETRRRRVLQDQALFADLSNQGY